MNRRNVSLVATAIAAAILVGLSGYWIGLRTHTSVASTAAPAGEQVDPQTGGKVLYWHDPMVPGQKFDRPGKSPFMDMELVPVYADEASDTGTVNISPRTVQNLGVRTVEVTQGELKPALETVGAVAVDERTIVAVQSRVSGYIEKLHVRAQYETVKRGQRLLDIYAPDWLSAQEEYLALRRATQAGAGDLAEAARERLVLLGIPESQIARLDETREPQARVTLHAPDGGVVWELGTREGSAVNPGMTLFQLASLRTVWVHAEVPEAQSAFVLPGARVTARAAAFPERIFKGRVGLILPDVNAVTRTVKARIEIDNPGGLLKPGMFARIELGAPERKALLVPSEAVIYTGTRSVVILAEGNGMFRPVEVETGGQSGDMTEIRSGLEAADKVVASGQFLIDSEASLSGVMARMNQPVSEQLQPPSLLPVHEGEGSIVAMEGDRVTIRHGPIESAGWGTMTMPFIAPEQGLPPGLAVGDAVRFSFITGEGGARLVSIAKSVAAPDHAHGDH